MKIVGMMLAREEDWVLGLSVHVALQWCDEVVVLLHAADPDYTADALRRDFTAIALSVGAAARRVHVPIRYAPGWPEMELRQEMYDVALRCGPTHLALIDADEILSAPTLDTIREDVEALPPGHALSLRMVAPWRGMEQYRTDPCVWTRAQVTAACAALDDWPTLAYAPKPDGYQHHARTPAWVRGMSAGRGEMLHLQWVHWDRLVWKHRLYKLRDRLHGRAPAHLNQMYGMALDETGLTTAPMPGAWLEDYPVEFLLERDPWHKRECEALLEAHGPALLEGLDLWGWPPEDVV